MERSTKFALALIAVGIVLRLGFLGADSFWLDEVYSVTAVLQHSAREAWETSLDPNHPPLFFVILWATLHLAGASEATARLPSALASVCNLGLLFALARRLDMSRQAAWTAVLLLALAPIDIWYAQEARMYALVTTAGLVFAIGLLATNSWTGAVVAGAALTAGLYVDFTMAPLSAALTSLWLVRWWHTGRQPLPLALVVVASTVAWWCFRPRWAQLGAVMSRIETVPLFVNLRDWFGLRLSPGSPATMVAILLAITAGIAAAAVWHALRNGRFSVWWTWLVGIGFAACTAGLMVPRGYSAKQFLATGWPFVVLVTAWTLTDGAGESGRRGETAPLARLRLPLAIGVSLVAAVVTVATARADWRGVVAYLNARASGAQIVWVDPSWNVNPYDYYRPTIAAVTDPLVSAESRHGGNSPGADVCLVAERFGRTPPTSPSEAWLDGHFRLVDAVPFARLELRCYTNRTSR